jgi:hypothetical protein
MLRAWLREMRTNLLGCRGTPKSVGRAGRTARLGVECLEARELLSGGVAPSYTLSDGNLYQVTATGQTLIDTGVRQFAVVNSKVFGLHTDGTFESMNGDGSMKAVVHQNVKAIGLRNDGQIFTDIHWSAGDDLYLYNPATGTYTDFGWVQGFAVGNDGAPYYLQNGTFYNGNTGGVVHQSVKAIGQRGDGQVFVEIHAPAGDDLYLYNPSAGTYTDAAYGWVQGFAVGNDGTPYYLQNGTFYNGNTGAVVHQSVKAIGQRNDGQVFTVIHWSAGDDLYLYNPASGTYTDFGWVQGFAAGNDDTGSYQLSPAALSAGSAGQPYRAMIGPPGGSGRYSFAVVSGVLPSGMTLSSTGNLSGTATIAGTYTFTVQGTDPSVPGWTGTQVCTLTVTPAAPAKISFSGLPGTMTVGQSATVVVTVQDAYGNGCSVPVALSTAGLALPSATVQTGSNGQASFTMTANHSGSVPLIGTAAGVRGGITVTVNPSYYIYTYTVYAWYFDEVVAQITWSIPAEDDGHAAQYLMNREAVWGQQLDSNPATDYWRSMSSVLLRVTAGN